MNHNSQPSDYLNGGPAFNQTAALSVSCTTSMIDGKEVKIVDFWRVSSQPSDIINKIAKKNREEEDTPDFYQESTKEEDNVPGMIFIAILDSFSETLSGFFTSVFNHLSRSPQFTQDLFF